MADNSQTASSAKKSAGDRVAAQRAAKAARKAARREPEPPPEPEDEIAESVEAASSWFDDNQRVLWMGFAGIVLVGALVLTVSKQRDGASRVATEALADGVKTAIAPVIPETDEAVEQDDSDRETYPTLQARAKSALVAQEQAVKEFGETSIGPWAKLGVANTQLELGDFAAARTAFTALEAAASGESPFFQYRVIEGLGFALEGQDKYAEAAKAFERAGKLAEGVYQPFASLEVARMDLALGKQGPASEKLKVLIEDARKRTDETGLDYSSAIDAAEARLGEMGIKVDKPASGLSADMLDQLRKQLGSNVKVLQGTEGAGE